MLCNYERHVRVNKKAAARSGEKSKHDWLLLGNRYKEDDADIGTETKLQFKDHPGFEEMCEYACAQQMCAHARA